MNLNENCEFTYGGKFEVQSYTCIKQLKKSLNIFGGHPIFMTVPSRKE
jgi:hypothetical protein